MAGVSLAGVSLLNEFAWGNECYTWQWVCPCISFTDINEKERNEIWKVKKHLHKEFVTCILIQLMMLLFDL